MWEGLGLGGGEAVGNWNSETTGKRKVFLGIGGGHYAPRHMDIVLQGADGYGQGRGYGRGWFSGLKVKKPAEKTLVFSPC